MLLETSTVGRSKPLHGEEKKNTARNAIVADYVGGWCRDLCTNWSVGDLHLLWREQSEALMHASGERRWDVYA